MAGKGPPPKQQRSRARDELPTTQLPRKAVRSPAMPPGRWSAATKAWWKTWAESEQAGNFIGTDWQRLTMLVPLVDAYHQAPSPALMTELRMNESKLGATPEDRLRLRWDLKPPDESPPTRLDTYANLRKRREAEGRP
jgi:hypothetical protein